MKHNLVTGGTKLPGPSGSLCEQKVTMTRGQACRESQAEATGANLLADMVRNLRTPGDLQQIEHNQRSREVSSCDGKEPVKHNVKAITVVPMHTGCLGEAW